MMDEGKCAGEGRSRLTCPLVFEGSDIVMWFV